MFITPGSCLSMLVKPSKISLDNALCVYMCEYTSKTQNKKKKMTKNSEKNRFVAKVALFRLKVILFSKTYHVYFTTRQAPQIPLGYPSINETIIALK